MTKNRLRHRQIKQKLHHDKHAKDLPPLHQGDSVVAQNMKTRRWEPRVIAKKCQEPRSYIVDLRNGTKVCQNRVHLRLAPAKCHMTFHLPDEPPPPAMQPAIVRRDEAARRPQDVTLQANPARSIAQQANADRTYHTRYGRTIKPPKRFNL